VPGLCPPHLNHVRMPRQIDTVLIYINADATQVKNAQPERNGRQTTGRTP
jgi:hypothetical protein